MTLLTVLTSPLCSHDALHEDDRDYPELTDIHVENSIPAHLLADAALDIFHTHVPIKRLDDFEFAVYYGGAVLMPDLNHDAGTLSDRGEIIRFRHCALNESVVQCP